MSSIRVRTAASTSNLGPGFDFLGLALELWLEVEREDLDGPAHVVERDAPEPAGWRAEEDLVARAFDAALRARGVGARPSRFRVRSPIPVGRGLGSSGGAVAAGLYLGALAAGEREPAPRALAEEGLALEGHPDNVSASLFGGCTLSVPTEAGLRVVRAPLASSLRFTVAWSDAVLETPAARAALPRSVPFADAVENPRRLALLLEGLRTADTELLRLGVADRLHVAARTALIPGAARARAGAARAPARWRRPSAARARRSSRCTPTPTTARRSPTRWRARSKRRTRGRVPRRGARRTPGLTSPRRRRAGRSRPAAARRPGRRPSRPCARRRRRARA
ncbi:MAG: homoserine kinase [Planctomycetes bacterium]|nr:homoserine kinase [Planctomycetota bacterium]